LLVVSLVALTTVKRAPTRSADVDGVVAVVVVAVELVPLVLLEEACELCACEVVVDAPFTCDSVVPGGSLVDLELVVVFLELVPLHDAR
jgi:hypothetical protein